MGQRTLRLIVGHHEDDVRLAYALGISPLILGKQLLTGQHRSYDRHSRRQRANQQYQAFHALLLSAGGRTLLSNRPEEDE
jgi:hypothetical protein